MKYLISFCNLNQLFVTQNKTSPLAVIDTDNDRIYLLKLPAIKDAIGITGICQDEAHIFAAYQSHQNGIVTISKYGMNPLTVTPLKDSRDIHSIMVQRNMLFVVSTGTDTIMCYGLKKGLVLSEEGRKFWNFTKSDGTSNTQHINSIAAYRNKMLISAFGTKTGVLKSSATHGYIVNLTSNRRVFTNIYHPHSLVTYKNDMYYCESARKAIYKNRVPIATFNTGYIRGLAVSEKLTVVGLSSYRMKSKSTGIIQNPFDNTGRLKELCRMVMLQYSTDNTKQRPAVSYYNLAEYSSEIYDIIPLSFDIVIDKKNILLEARLQKRNGSKLVKLKSL